MPKICNADGCSRFVFSNNFCQVHQYLRTDKKWLKSLLKEHKKGNTKPKIKPVSEKQSKKLREYEKGKKEKEKQLKENNEWCCIFCGEPFKEDDHPDWHHLFGRDGDLVSDMRFIFPSHTYCHITIYHWGSYSLLSSQRWYSGFLERLKKIDVKLYNKELRKKDKHEDNSTKR